MSIFNMRFALPRVSKAFNEPLYLEFSFADAAGLIPVDFSQVCGPILKAYTGNSLTFAPAALSVKLA